MVLKDKGKMENLRSGLDWGEMTRGVGGANASVTQRDDWIQLDQHPTTFFRCEHGGAFFGNAEKHYNMSYCFNLIVQLFLHRF